MSNPGWDKTERRQNTITLDMVELALRKYLDSYKKDLENMCEGNVDAGILIHTEKKAHFEKEEKAKIFETISYVSEKKKAKWGLWIPIILIGITSFVNVILLIVELKILAR